jgi:preprotein translocase subunit SecF
MFSLIGKTNVNFVGQRYIGFALSSCLILLGLFGIYRIASGKAKLAIDFSGGTTLNLLFEKVEPVDGLRRALKAEYPDAEIQQIADKPQYLIRVRKTSQEAGLAGDRISQILQAALPGNRLVEKNSEEVGPAVSGQLRQKALYATLISMLLITVYIAFRFDFRFAVGAFVATIHDVLAVLGLMVFLDRDFSLLIVTALLTLAGYSLTDTVVVFDRIRETLRLRRSDPYADVVNVSINETLSRTINTSMTVLLVVVVLFFWGGAVIHDFSLSLILGVLVGTYSSIYVASPLVVEWNLRSPSRR